jgi:hypothetical protein
MYGLRNNSDEFAKMWPLRVTPVMSDLSLCQWTLWEECLVGWLRPRRIPHLVSRNTFTQPVTVARFYSKLECIHPSTNRETVSFQRTLPRGVLLSVGCRITPYLNKKEKIFIVFSDVFNSVSRAVHQKQTGSRVQFFPKCVHSAQTKLFSAKGPRSACPALRSLAAGLTLDTECYGRKGNVKEIRRTRIKRARQSCSGDHFTESVHRVTPPMWKKDWLTGIKISDINNVLACLMTLFTSAWKGAWEWRKHEVSGVRSTSTFRLSVVIIPVDLLCECTWES